MTLDEFGLVTLRENVPGFYMLPRAGGFQLVHGPGSKPPSIYTVRACEEFLATHPKPADVLRRHQNTVTLGVSQDGGSGSVEGCVRNDCRHSCD